LASHRSRSIGRSATQPAGAPSIVASARGNPVTATQAKAVIDFIEEQNLLANCSETGAYLRGRLNEIQEKHRLVGEVRGMGLIQGLELVEDRRTKVPATAQAAAAMEVARQHGVLVGKGGTFGNVLRVTPPMNVGRADVDQFIEVLDKALAACQTMAAAGVR